MRLVPIYLNPHAEHGDPDGYARDTLCWLGVPSAVRLSQPPPGSRHAFSRRAGGVQLGVVMTPTNSGTVAGTRGQLLTIFAPDGQLLRLSAADVAEQASVGGCGLSWATGRPDSWLDVAGAPARKGGAA